MTDVAGPSIVRERTLEIERGAVLAGRYQVEAIIGRGGSGVVLRAFDRTAQMVVAVKVLKPELVDDVRWSKRFSRELRLGRPIRHPNVCRIFDIGEGDGHRFLTMELATEGTLRDFIKKGEPLRPFPQRLADAQAAIAGLAAIHEAGIVHRDVKPDNMLRMQDGRLALSDFGLATDLPADAGVTVMVGTPHYMAPEVRAGEPATTRSDVWSLGVALYEIFFGRRPERRSSVASDGMSKPPAPLTSTPLERAMLALCERCLAENSSDRPPDAREVLRLLGKASQSPKLFIEGKRIVVGLICVIGFMGIVGASIKTTRRLGVDGESVSVAGGQRLTPSGIPVDWEKAGRLIVDLPGHVHCVSAIGQETLRIVWGTPRRAEDLNVKSLRRDPSSLAPETYQFGCPQVSGNGRRLLFAASSSVGTTEIRVSESPSGVPSSVVTGGTEPIWLRGDEEFVYNIDPYHAAVFSFATKSLSLLPDSGLRGRQLLIDKAASRLSDKVALLLLDNTDGRAAAMYDRKGAVLQRTVAVGAGIKVAFDTVTDELLLSYKASPVLSTLAVLNMDRGTFRHVGRFRLGFDVIGRYDFGRESVLLARQKRSDAWLYTRDGRRRLTTDGKTYSAAVGAEGEMLLSRVDDEGALSIWRETSDGKRRQVTKGSQDVLPTFAMDGRRWAYVDYARKAISVCEQDEQCAVLKQDDLVPTWPRFSPSGSKIAYVTQAGVQRVVIVSLTDGAARDLGASSAQCPPLWASEDRVWIFQGSAGRYSWVERGALLGNPTGREIDIPQAPNSPSRQRDEVDCWGPGSENDLFLPRVQVEAEEKSSLLRLGGAP